MNTVKIKHRISATGLLILLVSLGGCDNAGRPTPDVPKAADRKLVVVGTYNTKQLSDFISVGMNVETVIERFGKPQIVRNHGDDSLWIYSFDPNTGKLPSNKNVLCGFDIIVHDHKVLEFHPVEGSGF